MRLSRLLAAVAVSLLRDLLLSLAGALIDLAHGVDRLVRVCTDGAARVRARAPGAGPQESIGMTAAARDVLAERRRQIEGEGYSLRRDDEYIHGELARAASCYAMQRARRNLPNGPLAREAQEVFDALWPWRLSFWKPRGDRRNLIRAGALILAEIERLDRAAARHGEGRL